MDSSENPEDVIKNEALCLKKEFEWLLTEEVPTAVNRLYNLLRECTCKFSLPLHGNEEKPVIKKSKKYILTAPTEKLKTVLSIVGDNIVHADIQFKAHRQHHSTIYRTCIQKEHPWKLFQLQDAANHLQQALLQVETMRKECCSFCSSNEVLYMLEKILGFLQRGRMCLILPKKKSIEELKMGRDTMFLVPALPEDLLITFYIQSQKIILAVYQINKSPGSAKFDVYQSECIVPWINDIIILFTIALQICQQLKDKICVFAEFKNITITPKRPCNVTIKT